MWEGLRIGAMDGKAKGGKRIGAIGETGRKGKNRAETEKQNKKQK